MKANKSPGATAEVTQTPKKLKQARLPFKLISDVSPKPESPPTRKRKLSAPESDLAPKVGKICKENDLKEDLVVISDDDSSKDSKNTVPEEKSLEVHQASLNPFVKIVDTAWKKKLQKTKAPKKKKTNRNKISKSDKSSNYTKELPTAEKPVNGVSAEDSDDVEMMDTSDFVEVLMTSKESTPNKTLLSVNNNKQETDESDPKNNKQDSTVTKNTSTDPNDSIVKEDDSCDKTNEESRDKSTESNPKNKGNKTKSVTNTQIEPQDESDESKSENNGNKLDKEEKSQTEPADPVMVTPKRSSRVKEAKTKSEEKSNELNNSKLNESVSSNPSTPKQTKKGPASQGDVPASPFNTSVTPTRTPLTPKQLQKKLDSAKKREEREKEKQEREKKRQQEKEERDRIRKEKEDAKRKEREEREDAKRKEKEDKDEARRKEREEKERQKELEKKLREEKEEQKKKEREEKEEQKRKEKEVREEEKRKKQEALELEKQELELKKKKAAEAFANFFVPKQKDKDQATIGMATANNLLSSFTIKSDMRLAPTTRSEIDDDRKKQLEESMKGQSVKKDGLYVSYLKGGRVKPGTAGKTWPLTDKDDDVMIVEDELPPADCAGEVITCESAVREKLRPKLFSFHENRRPPYWGTWRKKSPYIKPRRPFGQDEKQLEYEVDSDEEWEEEAEGESLDGSAAGSDAEPEDQYEVDHELFVPHGYLSDEEGTLDEDDAQLSLTPEAQKARLKHLEDEFESEMKKPTEKLKPRLYGIIWETKDGTKPEKCVDALWNYFGKLAMIMNDPTPLLQPAPETEEAEKKKSRKKKTNPENEQPSPKSEKKKKPKQDKEPKKAKVDSKKNTPEVKKNQLGINNFLTKLKSQ